MILHRFQRGPVRIDFDEPIGEHTPHQGYTRGPGHAAYKPNNELRPEHHEHASTFREPYHNAGATLDCECWCGEGVVLVTPRDVLNGRTASCGLFDCSPAWCERTARMRARDRRRGMRYKRAGSERLHGDPIKRWQLSHRC